MSKGKTEQRPGRERGIFERPTGSGIWWIRYADEDGREHREKVGPKGLATKVYQKRKTAVRERRFFPEAIRRREIPLKEVIDDYVARCKGRIRNEKDVKRNARLWKEALGWKPIRQITPGDIQRYATRRLAEDMSKATVNRELTFIRSVFYMAKGDDQIENIPFGKGAGKVKLFKENNQRVRYLTDAEETELRKQIGDAHWPKIAFALYTGFRQGNQFRVRWDDVNFDTGLIRARHSKSGEDYYVPMNDELRRILGALPSRMRSAWVFPSDTGATALDAKNFMHRNFLPAVERAKITDFRWHDLRHSFASRLVMAGVDLPTVQELMGHKTIQMTQRYAHLSPAHRLAAVQRLNPDNAATAVRTTGTTTGTRPIAAEVTPGSRAQVVDLSWEKSEPSGTRTQDPLLKRQMLYLLS